MDEDLRHQRDTALRQLEALIRRGRQIGDARAGEASRAWQQDCAAAINQLSGGSKAHWLARAYSEAFLVRSAFAPLASDGSAKAAGVGGAAFAPLASDLVVEADPTEIVERILGVLAQGAATLSRMDDVAAASSGAAPRPRRFEFVHDAELRPVLEQSFADSRDALERGEFALALILSCSVIEAVLTDALDHAGTRRMAASAETHDAREGCIADLSFERRIAAAERAGLIRGGCARLPSVARRYRDLTDPDGELRADALVSEREARRAGQVLHVVIRDLDPGR
jgi:hypothetical protein